MKLQYSYLGSFKLRREPLFCYRFFSNPFCLKAGIGGCRGDFRRIQHHEQRRVGHRTPDFWNNSGPNPGEFSIGFAALAVFALLGILGSLMLKASALHH